MKRSILLTKFLKSSLSVFLATVLPISSVSAEDQGLAQDDFLGAPAGVADEAVDVDALKRELSDAGSKTKALEKVDKSLMQTEKEILERMKNQATEAAVPAVDAAPVLPAEEADVKKAAALDAAIDGLSAPQNQESDSGIEVIRPKAVKANSVPRRVTSDDELEPIDGIAKVKDEEDDKAVNTLRSSNASLKNQVNSGQRKLQQLQKELDETRNRLIIAETEVERLSSVLAERNKASISKITGTSNVSSIKTSASREAPRAMLSPQQESKATSEMPIATVTADKAHLRTGPGKDNSPLMAVTRGTRLAVETRNGEWYRVIAPTGARAWVASEVLAFGGTADQAPSRTVRVKGYQTSPEEEATKLISHSR